jgi:putative spermidine/putrescine transport system permease protein
MMRILGRIYVGLFMLFLLAPIVAIAGGSLTATNYVAFPPKGLTLHWYSQILHQHESLAALGLSLGIAAAAATLATLLALPVGLALSRYRMAINGLVYLVVMTPAMLPSVFLGLAFLVLYTAIGLAATPLGLLAGHVMIATPFALSLILVGLSGLDGTLERAARSLGASPFGTFLRITLPLVSWSLAAGWGFAFMISFGSLEVSLFLSTSTMVTLPVQIFMALEWSPLDPALTAISSGLAIITLVVLLVTARFVSLERFLRRV